LQKQKKNDEGDDHGSCDKDKMTPHTNSSPLFHITQTPSSPAYRRDRFDVQEADAHDKDHQNVHEGQHKAQQPDKEGVERLRREASGLLCELL
jgi:hypothetical protein